MNLFSSSPRFFGNRKAVNRQTIQLSTLWCLTQRGTFIKFYIFSDPIDLTKTSLPLINFMTAGKRFLRFLNNSIIQ